MSEPIRTPRWSWKSWAFATAGFAVGCVFIAVGGSPWIASDIRSANLIDAGMSLAMTSLTFVIGRATIENGLSIWRSNDRRAPKDRRGAQQEETVE